MMDTDMDERTCMFARSELISIAEVSKCAAYI
jgi:hypothetical protein